MSTNGDIQEVKARVDIVAVVSRYVKLKKAGRNYTGLCPFHGEKTPSFNVNPSLGIFKCFGCGKSGDAIKFVQEIEHLEFPQALEKLAEEVGITLQKNEDPAIKKVSRYREAYKIIAELYHYILMNLEQGKNALSYAKNKRKLTEATIAKYKIGYAPFDNKLVQRYLSKKGFSALEIKEAGFVNERGNDKYTDRLMFPIFDTGGQVVGFSGRVIQKEDIRPKYLNSAESILFKKRFTLFGLNFAKDAISKKDMAIICEGQLDAITSHQVGVEHVVAPLGTGLTDTQISLLSRYTKNIAFCFDNDQAGQKSVLRGVQLAVAQDLSVYIVSLPPDVKDIDDLIQKRPDDWLDRASHPQEYFQSQIATLKGLMKKDVQEFERNLHQITELLGHAPELKQNIVAKQYAEALGLSFQGILAAIQKTLPPTFVREEMKQKQGVLSTSEYLLSLVLLFPMVTLLMGKPEKIQNYFIIKEQRELFLELCFFAKKHEHLVKSVYDKKERRVTVSWDTIYSRFANEVSLDFSRWIAEISEKKPEAAELIERIGLSDSSANIVISDDVVTDFFRAWTRLKRQSIALKLEVLRKELSTAEAAQNEEAIEKLQADLSLYMSELKKIEKHT